MEIYAVGGAVRDELLGLPVKDRDYVVVGATPEQMVQAGFRPVGRDFPVFLHPETHEEYALARTERKSGRGYRGFQVYTAPDVTLEQDLARRDLTINAIAKDAAGRLIDPFGGVADLRAGVLRHVGEAFVEDPVRLLRIARFRARFGFRVAPETFELMRTMVASGEVDALVAERVWQELARGLMERDPAAMIETLDECGALERILPEWTTIDRAFVLSVLAALRRPTDPAMLLEERFALLLLGTSSANIEAAADRLRVPTECRDMALLVARHAATMIELADAAERAHVDESLAARFLAVLLEADALRRPQRFERALAVVALVARLRAATASFGEGKRWHDSLAAARAVDAGAIAATRPADLPGAIRAARCAAVLRAIVK